MNLSFDDRGYGANHRLVSSHCVACDVMCEPVTTDRKTIVPTLIESCEDKEIRLNEKVKLNHQQHIRETLSLLKRQTEGDAKDLVELDSLLS